MPHSEISGSMSARNSPELIAACYVLHRLSVPRHSPDALIALDLALPSCTENKPDGVKPAAISRQLSANQLNPVHDKFTQRHIYPCRHDAAAPRSARSLDRSAHNTTLTASAVRIKKTSLHNAKEPSREPSAISRQHSAKSISSGTAPPAPCRPSSAARCPLPADSCQLIAVS